MKYPSEVKHELTVVAVVEVAVQVATPVPHKTQTSPDGEEEYPVIQVVA